VSAVAVRIVVYMGISEWSKKLAKAAFYGGDKAGDIQNLAIPMDRQLDLNPERKELEWMDAVELYETDYWRLRVEHGWKPVKGWEHQRSTERFLPVRWQIGETIVEAKYVKVDGLHIGVVQERVIKS
jgi:hypothetical protein